MTNVINHPDAISEYGTTVYAPLARTATPNTQEYELYGDVDELTLSINVTNVTATGTLVVKVEGVDRVAGTTFPLATTASISANGEYTIMVGPSLPAVATNPNISANVVVPNVIRVTATHGNGVSLTYSVELLLS